MVGTQACAGGHHHVAVSAKKRQATFCRIVTNLGPHLSIHSRPQTGLLCAFFRSFAARAEFLKAGVLLAGRECPRGVVC